MKNPILTIFKKEMARFLGDRRLVFTILMPGILIYIVYSLMGNALANQYSVDDNYSFSAYAVNLPDSIAQTASAAGWTITEIDADDLDPVKDSITNQSTDLCMVFPAGFDAAVAAYSVESGNAPPDITLYYNSVSSSSQMAFEQMRTLLDGYESSLANKFDVNQTDDTFDLASEKDLTGSVFSSMLPMLLMMLMFSGCMAIAPESIAGEKERGTIATLLVTPVRRGHIALGKILALSLISLISGVSSAIGTILSLPRLMGAAGELNGSFYAATDYLWLALIVLSTVLLFVSAVSVVSAFAKSTKEAATFATPLMILVMLIGITAMFGSLKTDAMYFFIPLYNTVQSMLGIFSFHLNPAHIVITIVVNLCLSCVFAFILTRMFHSEKVIFSR